MSGVRLLKRAVRNWLRLFHHVMTQSLTSPLEYALRRHYLRSSHPYQTVTLQRLDSGLPPPEL